MNNVAENPLLRAVLLAAGPSSRLGQPKQLVTISGETLVRRCTRLLLALGLEEIAVVSGCGFEAVECEVSDLPVEIIRNHDWQKGMGASISRGVRRSGKGVAGVLIMVCDQWRLEKSDLNHLISTWFSDISRIFTACWNEGEAFVSGPPVIFPRTLIPELISVNPKRGARQVIDRNMDIVEFVRLDNARFDLDHPADLELMPG